MKIFVFHVSNAAIKYHEIEGFLLVEFCAIVNETARNDFLGDNIKIVMRRYNIS